jgi:pimeloyl-ACP methyl ester carboxylesterase
MRNEMKLCGFLRMLPLMLLVMMATTAGAQQADARTVIAESESIHTANGMEVREPVKISGIPQWITVRGKDLDNPLLLYIHGGPGDTMMGVSWTFQRPWEDYFTVVQWDQRGSGKRLSSSRSRGLLSSSAKMWRAYSSATAS